MHQTLTGRCISDTAVTILRATHIARLAGEFTGTIDLGRHFHQRRLQVA